jgi:hypothetical protein
MEGWVGPRAVLDAVVKRKIPSLCRKSNHRTPIVQPIAKYVEIGKKNVHILVIIFLSIVFSRYSVDK